MLMFVLLFVAVSPNREKNNKNRASDKTNELSNFHSAPPAFLALRMNLLIQSASNG